MQTHMSDPNITETHNLVASDLVVGTDVYGPDGKHIGQVERLILEKVSGRTSYAVLSFGGILGFAQDYYPVPWSMLTYDEKLGGFRVAITEEQMKDAPHFGKEEPYDWGSAGRDIDGYYGASRSRA